MPTMIATQVAIIPIASKIPNMKARSRKRRFLDSHMWGRPVSMRKDDV